MAALLAPAPRAAEAATEQTLWSATLTVQDRPGSGLGCHTLLWAWAGQGCTTALTSYQFSERLHGGVSRTTVEGLWVQSDGTLRIGVLMEGQTHDRIPTRWHKLVVGSAEFLFSNDSDQSLFEASWANSGLSWSAGDRVSVKLIRLRDDWRSWNPTLTVADVQNNRLGCGTTANPCSTALTDDAFVYGGVEYTMTGIVLDGGSATWTFDKNIPSGLQPFQIEVGNIGLYGGTVSGSSATNSASTLSWSAGDRVRLRLIGKVPAAPTGLSFSPGPRADTIAAAWTAPDDTLTARVTGYEVRYKELHAPNADATVAGDPTTGWVTEQVGTTPRATLDAEYALRRNYHGQVRALSASGPGPWSAQAQGAPKDPPGGPAATPLRLLSASRTSVSEGATVTITARLASAATSAVTIPLGVEGTAGTGDYSPSSPSIAIGAGQRSGSVTLTITDDSEVEGAEILYITPDIGPVRNDAVPGSSAVAYQVASLRIDIAASDQPAPTTTSSESDSPPPVHSDPYLAELQKRIVRCAESIKTTVDQYVAGTATAEQVRAARAASAACQS